MHKRKLLLVEDEKVQREALTVHLEDEGYSVQTADSAETAVRIIAHAAIDAVITDYNLPGDDGISLLEKIRSMNPEIPVILITAYGSVDSAVNSMKSGAFDYLTKPINIEELLVILKRALQHSMIMSENKRLKEELHEKFSVKGIIATSPKMQDVLNIAGRVAPSKASVLIRGESGTGKEVIARTIHYASPRKDKPFVAFNVAALSPTLIESELFGHEKGSFTGADRERAGRFEEAHCGTLFIDEIGDIPADLQTKFLRVLQESYVERIGSSRKISVDIRVIAATNRDLEKMMQDGAFREDLYYRLNVVPINLPPLCDRKEDILPLSDMFIAKFAEENGKDVTGFTREAFDAVMKYRFPGNIRELENMIERAVVLARESLISVEDLPPNVFTSEPSRHEVPADGLDSQVEELEKHLIITELRKSGGNQSKAARALGINERKLRYKLQKYNIT